MAGSRGSLRPSDRRPTRIPLFIFDWASCFWRLGMFLPFALFTGLFLKLGPGAFAVLCDRPRADGRYNHVGLFEDMTSIILNPQLIPFNRQERTLSCSCLISNLNLIRLNLHVPS